MSSKATQLHGLEETPLFGAKLSFVDALPSFSDVAICYLINT
jgi:hypothetical protein